MTVSIEVIYQALSNEQKLEVLLYAAKKLIKQDKSVENSSEKDTLEQPYLGKGLKVSFRGKEYGSIAKLAKAYNVPVSKIHYYKRFRNTTVARALEHILDKNKKKEGKINGGWASNNVAAQPILTVGGDKFSQ